MFAVLINYKYLIYYLLIVKIHNGIIINIHITESLTSTLNLFCHNMKNSWCWLIISNHYKPNSLNVYFITNIIFFELGAYVIWYWANQLRVQRVRINLCKKHYVLMIDAMIKNMYIYSFLKEYMQKVQKIILHITRKI